VATHHNVPASHLRQLMQVQAAILLGDLFVPPIPIKKKKKKSSVDSLP
jgi:hypothetical protein